MTPETLGFRQRHVGGTWGPLAPKSAQAFNMESLSVKTNGIPFWLVGEFTTHFRTYFSGDWDVHWGVTGILTHGHVACLCTMPCSNDGMPVLACLASTAPNQSTLETN